MKGRKHKSTGGADEAEADVKTKPEARTDAKNIDSEAEEKKHGGRAKRKHGGRGMMPTAHIKGESGVVSGPEPPAHAGKKPRKSGGRAAFASGGSSDATPFTSARKGKDAPGRSLMKGSEGFGET